MKGKPSTHFTGVPPKGHGGWPASKYRPAFNPILGDPVPETKIKAKKKLKGE